MAIVQQRDSRSTIHTDPVRNFKFIVEFLPHWNHSTGTPPKSFYKDEAGGGGGNAGTNTAAQTTLGFMSVSGLSAQTDAIPYREGGDNTTPRKLPGQSNFSDITLTRGVVIGSRRNWLWTKRIFHAIQGRGQAAAGGTDAYFRFTMDIHVLHHPVNDPTGQTPSKVSFRAYNCWPSSLSYSDLDAGGNAVFIEQMTVTHEGWEMRWATHAGAGGGQNFDGREIEP